MFEDSELVIFVEDLNFERSSLKKITQNRVLTLVVNLMNLSIIKNVSKYRKKSFIVFFYVEVQQLNVSRYIRSSDRIRHQFKFQIKSSFRGFTPLVYIEKCRVVQKFESETDLYALYDSLVFQTDPSSQLWKKGIIWADNFVPRVDWGAREPKGIENFPIPAEVGVMGHHTAWDRQLGLFKFRGKSQFTKF